MRDRRVDLLTLERRKREELTARQNRATDARREARMVAALVEAVRAAA